MKLGGTFCVADMFSERGHNNGDTGGGWRVVGRHFTRHHRMVS